ncbi:uncharacterized protein LOC106645241 [Copidosoma floridanum]|uniref:uncharacterized protein LOC106645241 n=1 Tax=Copidosoma floridanum TaxID=29053 RepID=UPI0006C973B4|nr:uncharacterized protein LOC106645241 [Copidosoma floridanum]
MANNLTELEVNILKCLHNISCCLICSLRFCEANFMDPNFFFKSFLSKALLLNEYNSLQQKDLCTMCVGILQFNNIRSSLKKIKIQLNKFYYDSTSVNYTLNVPTSIYIRERSISEYLCLQMNFSSFNYNMHPKIQSLKDTWKYLINLEVTWMSSLFKKVTSLRSSVRLDVFYFYIDDQDECLTLLENYNHLKNRSTNYLKQLIINKKIVDDIVICTVNEKFNQYFSVPPPIPIHTAMIKKLEFRCESVFIGDDHQLAWGLESMMDVLKLLSQETYKFDG